MQLGVDRNNARLAYLTLPYPNGRPFALKRQVVPLERQSLRHPQSRTPLNQKQQSCPGACSCTYQGVHLVRLQVLGKWLGGSLRRVAPWLRVLPPWPATPLRQGGPLGCHGVAPKSICRLGHFLRAIVPIRGEVVQFKEWAQLRGPRPRGTFVPILMLL